MVLIGEDVISGKNGYIVEGIAKKLTKEQVEIIKNDTGSQWEKANKYNVSVGTINKIMNDKYWKMRRIFCSSFKLYRIFNKDTEMFVGVNNCRFSMSGN